MSNIFNGKSILYGVTGSIAAYKSLYVIRELVKLNAEVNVVMTQSASFFITPLSLANISRNKVIIEQFDKDTQQGGAWHILQAHNCDAMLIAPCSASSLGKIANGICDNALTTLAMALPRVTPLVIAPAMDTSMWLHPATQKNIELLKSFGVHIIPPESGDLSSGLTGEGRLPDTSQIVDFLSNVLNNNVGEKINSPTIEDIYDSSKKNIGNNQIKVEYIHSKENPEDLGISKDYNIKLKEALEKKIPSLNDVVEKDKWTAEYELAKMKNDMFGNIAEDLPLKGKKVLITAGPTVEKIDDIRFISNHSSGKMGFELAKLAKKMGGNVYLISGPVNLEKIEGVNHIDVITAEEMYNETLREFSNADISILSAAVSDFTPATPVSGKIKKKDYLDKMVLVLKPTKDILAKLGQMKTTTQKVIGFALESLNEIEYGWNKLKEKNCDMIVVNSAIKPKSGFGGDYNTITILTRDGKEESYPPMSKELCSELILKKILETQ